MVETKRDPVTILNDLIRSLKDAEIAFHEASHDIREEDYRKILVGSAQRMGEFETALREQVKALGGTASQQGTVSGQVHRMWIHVRSMLNLHHTAAVLLESEKAEESLLDHYEKAVEELPVDKKEVVEKQFVELIEIRTRLLELHAGGKQDSGEHKFLT